MYKNYLDGLSAEVGGVAPCPCDCNEQITMETWYLSTVCSTGNCPSLDVTETKKVCEQETQPGQYNLDCATLQKSLGSGYTLSGYGCQRG